MNWSGDKLYLFVCLFVCSSYQLWWPHHVELACNVTKIKKIAIISSHRNHQNWPDCVCDTVLKSTLRLDEWICCASIFTHISRFEMHTKCETFKLNIKCSEFSNTPFLNLNKITDNLFSLFLSLRVSCFQSDFHL